MCKVLKSKINNCYEAILLGFKKKKKKTRNLLNSIASYISKANKCGMSEDYFTYDLIYMVSWISEVRLYGTYIKKLKKLALELKPHMEFCYFNPIPYPAFGIFHYQRVGVTNVDLGDTYTKK